MKIAIVGHEASKFTPTGEARARVLIAHLLTGESNTSLVSGGCHLGGIDIWAEEFAKRAGYPTHIFLPAGRSWNAGYKSRNIQIARTCDILHCLAVDHLPASFAGLTYSSCYHCSRTDHVKGGGCWTMNYAAKLGRPTKLHIIENN